MAWWKGVGAWFLGRGSEPGTPPSVSSSEKARPATWSDVLQVARLLEEHQVEYALVGGYALNLNGIVRQTGDVDILVRDTAENNRRWVQAMCSLPDGIAKELLDDADAPFPLEDVDDIAEPGVIRIIDEFVVDILPKVCGLTYDELRPHMRHVETRYGRVRSLDLFGLELSKRGVRPKDVADRLVIRSALQSMEREKDSDRVLSRRELKSEPIPQGRGYEVVARPEVVDPAGVPDAQDHAADEKPPSPRGPFG